MKTNIDSVSQAIEAKGNGLVLTISSGAITITEKEDLSEIIASKGSLKSYLTELQNNYSDPLIIEMFKHNGSSFLRKGREVVTIDVEKDIPAAAGLGAAQAPAVHLPERIVHSPNVSVPTSLYEDKYKHAQELADFYKNETIELRNKNQLLFDQVRELTIKVDTADAKKDLELMAVTAANQASLNGLITDATKPETLSAIKDIIVALKGEATTAPVTDTLLSGIDDDESKIFIETIVKLLKEADKEFISKILMFTETMLQNKPVLDNIIEQINAK